MTEAMRVMVQIVAVLVLANLLRLVASRLRLPDLLGAMLAGILLGPSATGLVGQMREAGALPSLTARTIVLPQAFTTLSFLGLVALMVSAGLSIQKETRDRPGLLVPAFVVAALLSRPAP